jgi:hypothetical protein
MNTVRHSFTNTDDGLRAVVCLLGDGRYTVRYYDTDAGQTLSHIDFCITEPEALDKARLFVGMDE